MSTMPPGPAMFQAPPFEPTAFKPLSGAAVAALVSALVFPCVGVHVIVSLICALVGLVATSGGKARGRGLAIAAIPIALLLGASEAGVLYYLGRMSVSAIEYSMAAGHLLENPSETIDAAADEFYASRMTDDFKAHVSPDQFKQWAHAVLDKHGRATWVDMSGLQSQQPTYGSNQKQFTMNLKAKFVNGEETIATDVSVEGKSFLNVQFRIQDIAIGDIVARSFGSGGKVDVKSKESESAGDKAGGAAP